jgi:hypothetical protein
MLFDLYHKLIIIKTAHVALDPHRFLATVIVNCHQNLRRAAARLVLASGKCGKIFIPHDLGGSLHGITRRYILAVVLRDACDL